MPSKVMLDVSIIIPTYEPDFYLFECLESIACQTLDLKKIEVLLILNGIKQPFYEKITEYIRGKETLKIKLFHTDHAHVSTARNIGIQKARGKYLMFIDDDDLISPDYVKELLLKALTNGVVFSNVRSFAEHRENAEKNYLSYTYEHNLNKTTHNWMTLRSHMSLVWGKLIPVSVIKNKLFDKRFKNGQDALFMASISCEIKQYCLSSENAIYYWRNRKNSASRKPNKVSYEIRNTLLLMRQYLIIYFSAPLRYNILFFTFRLLAVLKRLRYRLPESRW
jgi:glycosyltransferase involved in cell wall biosynthesis